MAVTPDTRQLSAERPHGLDVLGISDHLSERALETIKQHCCYNCISFPEQIGCRDNRDVMGKGAVGASVGSVCRNVLRKGGGQAGWGTQELRESVSRLFSPDCESSKRKEVILLHLHFHKA